MMHAKEFDEPLKWLADAPLFIDDNQIERFYDAVARPDSRLTTSNLQLEESVTQKLLAKVAAKVKSKLGVPAWAEIEAEVASELTEEDAATQGKRIQQTFETIQTPQRQLIALTHHYKDNEKLRDRAFHVTDVRHTDWRASETIVKVPRQLVFLDLPGRSRLTGDGSPLPIPVKMIPVAAEFEKRIVPLFLQFRGKDGAFPPVYADDPEKSFDDLVRPRLEYWKWFVDNFRVQTAMHVLEDAAAEHGRIRWIDFRVPIDDTGATLHLHMAPGGRYDTGTFSYNMIRRGWEFGLRLVGTMKSEPDMDVLAVYDR